MKLPNHYPHLHRSQYKNDIEIAVDDLIHKLVDIRGDLQYEELKTVNEFEKKLSVFKNRLLFLHDNFNIITNDSAGRLNAVNKKLCDEKKKTKIIGIVEHGIATLKNVNESITKCRISNPRHNNVKNIDDIDNKLDREFYENILLDNISWGKGIVKYSIVELDIV